MIVSPKKAINLSCDSDLYKKEIFDFYAAKALACKCDFGFTKHYTFVLSPKGINQSIGGCGSDIFKM